MGSLRLASSPERLEELRRQAGWAKTFGLPLELIGPEDAKALFPLMSTDGVLGAVHLPTDGWLDPSGLAEALAAGARKRGATIRPHTRVVAIGAERGRVTGVTVEHRGEREEIAAEVVVNAGGMFAPEIGRMVGVTVPLIPIAHQYLFTEAIDGVHPGLPQLRDPDNLVYFREEVGGLCMGGYERDPAPWALDGIPPDFNGKLLAPDMPRFESIMDGAIRRVPAMAEARVSRVINGPEAFTPDNEFILGESDVRGFWVAAGFSAHGIAGAGGIGRQMASWIVEGEPELDLWKMDIRRFGAAYRSGAYTLARSVENYATYYDIHYPNEERQAGRPLRTSPTYDVLADLGAAFGEKSGWERPNWFEPNADDPRFGGRAALERLRPRGWAGRHWSPAIAAEALATRQAAALFDETSFAKLEVVGPGACAFLAARGRERYRSSGRLDRVHAIARPAWRDPGRPDRHATGTRALPARHRHGLRQPRRRVAARQPAGRWVRGGPRLHVVAGVLRAVGAASARHPVGRHARRRLERRLPVPHRARDHRGLRAGACPAGHVRRRARVGALRADRVRPSAVGQPLGGGSRARPGRRRLSSDRGAPAREGLPGLVVATSPPTRRRTMPGSGSRSRSTSRSRHGPRGARRGQGGAPRETAALPRAG